MKPQDILVILKINNEQKKQWTIAMIAESIGMSTSETHAAIKSCKQSGLFSEVTQKPILSGLEEFLIHGIKYSFPAEIGMPERGMPTAHSA